MPSILEGERLLQEVLKRDQHNADAWNIYLANYWRFSFAAVGHWFGQTVLSKRQANLIETALRNCPNDECIQLWEKAAKTNPEKQNWTILWEAITRHGYKQTDFPKIKYGYY